MSVESMWVFFRKRASSLYSCQHGKVTVETAQTAGAGEYTCSASGPKAKILNSLWFGIFPGFYLFLLKFMSCSHNISDGKKMKIEYKLGERHTTSSRQRITEQHTITPEEREV
jgi:hypothetical protein